MDKSIQKADVKESFIKRLTSMSIEEINQVIKDNGKKPKLVCPVTRIYKHNN